jgi:hypothetical protein
MLLPIGATCGVGIVSSNLEVIKNYGDLLVGCREEDKRAVGVGWIVGRITW